VSSGERKGNIALLAQVVANRESLGDMKRGGGTIAAFMFRCAFGSSSSPLSIQDNIYKFMFEEAISSMQVRERRSSLLGGTQYLPSLL